MKTEKYIFEKIASIENIKNAIMKASERKRSRKEVKIVMSDIDKHAYKLHKMLWTKTYKPCKPAESTLKEGANQKPRTVTKIDFFPDQIIHWAIILQIKDRIINSSYAHSCGCMPGKGNHYGKKKIERWIKTDRKNTKYCAKLDITKFYPSIQHGMMKERVRTIIKDPKALWLVDEIIDCHHTGLPIGFLTSQWLANFYLQNLDHHIKQKLNIKYYLRYMDDLVLFGPNKKKLHKSVRAIERYLVSEKLILKQNWQVFPIDKRDIDTMGFRFFRDKTILRKSLMLRISRKAIRIGKRGFAKPRDAACIISYMGWVKHTDTSKLYRNWIRPNVTIKQMKEVVSKFARGEIKKHENCKVRKRRKTITDRCDK